MNTGGTLRTNYGKVKWSCFPTDADKEGCDGMFIEEAILHEWVVECWDGKEWVALSIEETEYEANIIARFMELSGPSKDFVRVRNLKNPPQPLTNKQPKP